MRAAEAAHDSVSADEWASWRENGYFIRRGFVDASVTRPLLDEVVAICRRGAAGERVSPAYVLLETGISAEGAQPEDLVSKVFRLHRLGAFAEFVRRPDVLDLLAALLGEDVDAFLSQFIFKVPGACGQPWHQDSHYFPFTPDHQVGLWLAVTDATLDNGCLWVLPGTHRDPVHEHVKDTRRNAPFMYMEIVDQDTSAAIPVTMDEGDLLVFDSHLMHRSTDNVSDGIRAAMVYHFSPAGTEDRTAAHLSINDWVPVRRGGANP